MTAKMRQTPTSSQFSAINLAQFIELFSRMLITYPVSALRFPAEQLVRDYSANRGGAGAFVSLSPMRIVSGLGEYRERLAALGDDLVPVALVVRRCGPC